MPQVKYTPAKGLIQQTGSGFVNGFYMAGDSATLLYVDDTIGWIILGLSGVSGPPAVTV